MKNFSFLGCVINVILLLVYIFVSMVIAGMIYGALSGGQTDPVVQDKIGYLVIILVLIVTAICRKFFYKRIWTETEVIEENPNSYTKKVREQTTKKDGKMKIYVDKEIK